MHREIAHTSSLKESFADNCQRIRDCHEPPGWQLGPGIVINPGLEGREKGLERNGLVTGVTILALAGGVALGILDVFCGALVVLRCREVVGATWLVSYETCGVG